MDFTSQTFKIHFPPQSKHAASITNTSQLITNREIINVYCQNRTKHKKYTVLGKVETLSVTACGAKYRIISALSNVTANDTVSVFRMS